MLKRHTKSIIIFSILAIFLVSLIITLFFVEPEEIVNKIGVRNGYLLMFLVSFFGGLSAGGSLSFIALLVTLVAGGMSPFYLAIVSGASLILGDLILFYAGFKGRELIEGDLDKRIEKVAKIFKRRKWLKVITPLLAFIYIGLTPFPNDLVILFLAAIEYPPRKVAAILVLGDLTFPLVVAFLVTKGLAVLG